ncbi:MAG TPA: dihydrolipoamide acetyltransferase family protein [candidate division Zixibacteria bacterium]|nr:dihydrolipoamide acetyltransferase family protein [candidate division Zixibacteria bacterium]
MSAEVVVPQMGESVLEGTILEWKVKVGDKVELNQPLVELMTDKVNIEIPSEVSGVIKEILVKEGTVVPVGTRIAIIDDGSSGVVAGKDAKPATAAVSAPAHRAAAVGSSTPTPSFAATATAVAPAPRGTAPIGQGKMSPKVRMMMREYSLDPTVVTPTGKEGLVTVEDVLRAVEGRSQSKGFTAGPIPMPAPPRPTNGGQTFAPVSAAPTRPRIEVQIPRFQPLPPDQRETRMPLQGVRKLIADHMVKSKHTSPHVTTFEEIDFTELVNYRNTVKLEFKATYGANITFMPFIIKAATTALKNYPKLNASITDKEIIYKNFYNIGIAVARDEGLIVPVIKDADKKTIVELAVEIDQLGNKARTNQLKPDDVADGTLTITNAGMFGATASTPIINQPQVAILGVHAIMKRPWVVNNEIKIRDISTFGLSFDHRLVDGHVAVQFLHQVHEYLADPTKLLLQLR